MERIHPSDLCNVSSLPFSISRNPLRVLADNLHHSHLDKSILDYVTLKPNDSLADLYGVPESNALSSFHHTCIFLPWIHYHPVEKYRDQFSALFFEIDYFKKQCSQMRNLVASISERGYLPEEFPTRQGGHITGYYLEHEGINKFYIVSGNHRAAALAHLFGDQKFNAIFDRQEFLKERDLESSILGECYPNTFSSENIDNWPSVTSGFLQKDTALRILESYVDG